VERPAERGSLRTTQALPTASAARRATIESLHHIPKDDAWKQAYLATLGRRAWLHCDGCRHSIIALARAGPSMMSLVHHLLARSK
jgi:hypothetical protein